jgi:hypothetical protein
MTIYGRTILFADSKGKIFSLDEKISNKDYFKAFDLFSESLDFSAFNYVGLTGFYIHLDKCRIMYRCYEI